MHWKKPSKPVAWGLGLIVMAALALGAVPLARKIERDQKLHEALLFLNITEAKRLVLAGAEDHCDGKPGTEHLALAALMLQHGTPDVLEVLVRHGLKVDRPLRGGPSPIQVAVGSNNLANVRYLLDQGVGVNAPFTANEGESPGQSTPLVSAAADAFGGSPRLPLIKLLLDAGAEVNQPDSSGRTALHVSTSPEVLKELVKRGADLEARDRRGNTPLLSAVAMGRFAAIRTLLNAGARIDAVDTEGNGVLHLVNGGTSSIIGDGDPKKSTIHYLITHGADVFARNAKGQTPLHLAVEHRNTTDVRALIAQGADPRARDQAGFSARERVRALDGPLREAMVRALAGLAPPPPRAVSGIGGGLGSTSLGGPSPMSAK